MVRWTTASLPDARALSAEDLLRRTWSPIARIVTIGVVMLAIVGCAQSRQSASPAVTVLPAKTGPLRTVSQWLDERQVAEMSSAQWDAVARRSSVVVLNSWNYQLIPVLKRANPNVSVWVYKDLSGIRSDDCAISRGICGNCRRGIADSTLISSGLGYCWTIRHHPGWLLRSAVTGESFQFRHYPGIWETDYGNLAYQRLWIRNVLEDVRAHGWDGVAVDNALTTADAYGVAAKYRTDASVQTATYSALRTIGRAFRRAGVASVFNVGYATRFAGLWQRWLRPVGGLEQEFYLAHSNAPAGGWRAYQREISSCAALHKSCWFTPAHAQPTGISPYVVASYLLAASGRQLLGVASAAPAGGSCRQLGPPSGAAQQIGPEWRRYFQHGVAVVNPADEQWTVPLGGSYRDQRGRMVDSITLQPATGAVLLTGPPGASDATASGGNGSALC